MSLGPTSCKDIIKHLLRKYYISHCKIFSPLCSSFLDGRCPPSQVLQPRSEKRVGPDVRDLRNIFQHFLKEKISFLQQERQNGGVSLRCPGHLRQGGTVQDEAKEELLVIALNNLLHNGGDSAMFLGDGPPIVEESLLSVLQLRTSSEKKVIIS